MLCICDLASIGSFTQEDPIGLAGGMNLYGFAGGDPVNFADPFGLSECSRDKPADCTVKDVGKNVLAGIASVTGGGGEDSGPGFQTGQLLGLASLALPGVGGMRGLNATAATRGAVLNAAKAEGRSGFGLAPMTAEQFAQVATDFAGAGARLSSNGKALVSADATFVARFPAVKTYGGATSTVSGNLIVRNRAGAQVINAHVPITLGPNP